MWKQLVCVLLTLLFSLGRSTWKETRRELWTSEKFMESKTVRMNCTNGGYPICCELLQNDDKNFLHYAHGDRAINQKLQTLLRKDLIPSSGPNQNGMAHCMETRKYVSSPYEKEQIAKAEEISKEPDRGKRMKMLADFVEQDVPDSNKWLHRVEYHMFHRDPIHQRLQTTIHPDDERYMSRFEITLQCGDTTHRWNEWIEPITVHMRHPFSFIEHCPLLLRSELRVSSKMEYHSRHITDTDYILVQDYEDYYFRRLAGKHLNEYRKFFFDAGSHYYYTGTAWFTCAYQQVI